MRIVLMFLVAALAVGGAAVGLLMWRDASPERVIEAEMAGRRFVYAQSYARDEATTAGGMTDRLSFLASFPNFRAPAPKDRAATSSIAITLTLKDDGPDPADRPHDLYARFFGEEAEPVPGGLILRRFETNSPYDLEQLYLAPPDGRSFFARCPKPGAAPGDTCLSIFRDGAIDVELRYAPALLEHWEQLYSGARAMISRMTTRPKNKAR